MIIVRLSGGMGNQMFQYALGRVLSLTYNVPLKLNTEALQKSRSPLPYILPKWRNYPERDVTLGVWNIKADIATKKEIPWQYRKHGNTIFSHILEDVTHRLIPHKGAESLGIFRNGTVPVFKKEVLHAGPDVYLDGWWQNPKYFEGYEEIIRNDFTLKEPLSIEAQSLYNEINSQNSVSIHVRRGDYLKGGMYTNLDAAYYQKGVAYIATQTSIDTIYIFSNDISWCKDNLKFDFPVIFVDQMYAGKFDEGHLVLMSAAKQFVIANSTFSWWAAWLGASPNKVVIAPKKWFNDASINTDDLIPSEWVQI